MSLCLVSWCVPRTDCVPKINIPEVSLQVDASLIVVQMCLAFNGIYCSVVEKLDHEMVLRQNVQRQNTQR
jgi:hypothetical protein